MNAQTVPVRATADMLTRRVIHVTRGRGHGPIARLMSPGDLDELLKPFVFLDFIDTRDQPKPRASDYGLHPHSGIATLTWLYEGEVNYQDTTGRRGQIAGGHVEWMRAGGGAWHGGNFGDGDGRVRGFQLWIALPPELELSEAISTYLAPHEIPVSGPVTVLLGQHGACSSAITPPSPINYLSVRLRAGERWTYRPPAGHAVAWAAVSTGELELPVTARAGDMLVFAPGEADIEFLAHADAEFVLGSAVPHPHRLVSGQYSVHTTEAALREGEARIDEIGRALLRRTD